MFQDRYADGLRHDMCDALSEYQLSVAEGVGVPVQVNRPMRTSGDYGFSFSPRSMKAP
jgi:hypothetical protein